MVKGNEKTESTYKIGQRIPLVLKHCGLSPTDISRFLRTAYDIRSKYVHGSKSKDYHENIEEIEKRILEYTRLSILIFLQLKNSIDKEDLIKLIDEAMLDSKQHEILQNLITDNCILSQ